MKFLFFFTAFIVINVSSGEAQDLILTTKNDSINCKIVRVTTGEIVFVSKHSDEVIRTKLPVADVKLYEKDFYLSKNTSSLKVKKATMHDRFTLSVSGGFSYLIAKTSSEVPKDFKPYIKELKSGYHVGGDIAFFISENIGVGLKYVNFNTSNETYVTLIQPGQTKNGIMRDDVTTHFIAPTFVARSISMNQKTIFNAGYSLGYLGYSNDAVLIDKFKITGSTVGMGFDLGIEQKISNTFGLELKLGAVIGSLGKVEISNGTSVQTKTLAKEERENISRIDISLGLKLHR
ncbi:MAG: hypothetical protein H7X88_03030 [Gloeobacteraceae cyanobacterium ES-bin-316]|nr:hypothetical protein [Ferruginibacter sp.]